MTRYITTLLVFIGHGYEEGDIFMLSRRLLRCFEGHMMDSFTGESTYSQWRLINDHQMSRKEDDSDEECN
jgi:hypothetical protein